MTMMINTCEQRPGLNGLEKSIMAAEDEAGTTLGAPTSAPQFETIYSWHYYEREDQFEGLFDVLNLKGQRERKLQENLKKIKDRLKLKKAKKVANTATNMTETAKSVNEQSLAT